MKKKYILNLVLICFAMLSGCQHSNSSLTDVSNIIPENEKQKELQEQIFDNFIEEVTEELKEEIIEAVYEDILVMPKDYLLIQKPKRYIEYKDELSDTLRLSYSIEGLDIINDGYDNLQSVLNEYGKSKYSEMVQKYNASLAFFSDIPEDEELYDTVWHDDLVIEITRSDSKILSFCESDYSYLGGKNSSITKVGYNIDSQTGNTILLSDLVEDYDKLYQYVIDYFENDFIDKELFSEDYIDSLYKCFYAEQTDEYGISYSLNWYVDQESLHLLFNPYIFGSLSKDLIEIEINQNNSVLKADYFSLSDFTIHKLDKNEIEDFKLFNIMEEANCLYEVKTKENVIYYCIEAGNKIYIYTYKNNVFQKHQTIEGIFATDITNPNYVFVLCEGEVLGYSNLCKLYEFSQNGELVLKDNNILVCDYNLDLVFENGFVKEPNDYLKLKIDITDENGYILSGTKWFPIEVIDGKYILFDSINNKRMKLSYEDGKISNMDEEDLFEGIKHSK